MLRKWALPVFAALAVAAVVIAGAGAVAQPAPMPGLELSNRAAVAKYLASHGITTKRFVIQRGARNYAGPSCPGKGWTCTTSKRVVQISFGPNVTQFTCTASSGGYSSPPNDCLIVQISTFAPNSATCIEKQYGASIEQTCRILQTSTNGSNLATVQQQVDATTGAVQQGDQYTGIEQDSTNGSNNAQVSQVLNQTTNAVAAGIQSQDGFQTVSVLQNTTYGTNYAKVGQSQVFRVTAQYLPAVNQSQNTNAAQPNTAASIRQTSGTGTNSADLNQSQDLDATANRVTTANQTQGSPSGGLLGHFEQSSAGLSVVNGVQNEIQQLHATGVPNLTQTQWGPMHMGSPQGTNPADRYNATQTSTQNASSPLAFQDDKQFLDCDTSGTCLGKQTITQDGVTHTNTCSGPSCETGQTSTMDGPGSDSSTCSGFGSELPACPFPPSPPPPPSFGSA